MITYFHKSEQPSLSILICSLNNRKHLLDRLYKVLKPQMTDEIEVIVNIDDGEAPIGKKRNELMQAAIGKYCCAVDDDDLVSEIYCCLILNATNTGPDVVGIEGTMTTDGGNPKKFIHSLKYNTWYEENGVYYRCPNHLNPIKTDIAKQISFPEINSGEDSDFSHRVRPLIKTEVYIDQPVYFYDFRPNKSSVIQPLQSRPWRRHR